MSPTQHPTPNADVNMLLLTLLARMQTILKNRLVGFYLHGSLSLGDFDPEASDVDFLVVTTEELRGEILDELHTMHNEIAASGLRYANSLEGSYISCAALRQYDPRNARHPAISVNRQLQVKHHKSSWIIDRYIVREYGIILWGPSPKTLINPISPQQLREAVYVLLDEYWTKQNTEPEEWSPLHYQAYAVLSMCRVLYTLQYGTIIPKPQAAAWAIQTLEPAWKPLIERALSWRHQHEKDDPTETLAFVRYMINRSKEEM
ncbi:hypothetical protein KSF_084670 [Reticulibacter mediterranei]|uniref:Adenylyltransferase AadA C-terminal domain-containing protein n=1 Tax=Reticulibacter mediterranei TaxID=2778369 RepID=A0A8J3IV40_9CHLR|nr:aminoglycoside adenylyltransferase domain-containing protein [Reticulibacter mediterranei]GHO98419.1 hypothetical protein KSF_084670 [Reticulibacter mediterranei]